MCDRMGINVWEVIDAAATKPFGFMPFYPGPGLGGHCIPIDPFYLSWKSSQAGIRSPLHRTGRLHQRQMPDFVVEKDPNALNEHGKALKGSRVHVLGVAYKRDIDDVRESPALDIIHLLARRGATVTYSDPYVPSFKHAGLDLVSVPEAEAHKSADVGVIVTDHKLFDYKAMVKNFPLLVDTRNALKGTAAKHLFRL